VAGTATAVRVVGAGVAALGGVRAVVRAVPVRAAVATAMEAMVVATEAARVAAARAADTEAVMRAAARVVAMAATGELVAMAEMPCQKSQKTPCSVSPRPRLRTRHLSQARG